MLRGGPDAAIIGLRRPDRREFRWGCPVMRRFIRWAMASIVGLFVVFAAGAYVLPDEIVVQRQVVIAAPPERVFALINDLRRMNEWSPWAALDPNTAYMFEGPGSGVGQKMGWDSPNRDVGKGTMTIVESVENRRVATALEFEGMGTARASMELSPAGGGTGVTWGFKSELSNPLERWMAPLITRSLGDSYERGLAKLKSIAESGQGS